MSSSAEAALKPAAPARRMMKVREARPKTSAPEQSRNTAAEESSDDKPAAVAGTDKAPSSPPPKKQEESALASLPPSLSDSVQPESAAAASVGANGKADAPEADSCSKQQGEATTRNTANLTDFKKKQLRAERFGVELQVSEYEKMQLRAARFGAEGNSHTKGVDIVSEQDKKRARAARFGVVNEETKRFARLERFLNPNSSSDTEKKISGEARPSVKVTEDVIESNKKMKVEPPKPLASA